MTVKNLVLIALSSVLLSACSGKTIYSDFQSVPITGWNADSVLTFSMNTADLQGTYDVLLYVRHTDAYNYQNMWLFVGANEWQQDTIEIYLADDRGRWLSNGRTTMEMPVLYKENVRFTDSICTLTIQQGMRSESLKGVLDIGVEIIQHGKE